VSVLVKNVGSVAGAETVLIFTFDEYRRTTPEYKRLRAFGKVFLQPNEAVWVNVTIPSDDLRFVGPHDDHHYIRDLQMSYWIGVGSSTDCRNNIKNESIGDLMCSYITALTETTSHNIDACNAACDIWINQSGCADHFGITMESCLRLCTSINEFVQDSSSMVREGWGWNYVNCIESVVVGFHQQHSTNIHAANNCWKMTTLCRDIFRTPNLDEYGIAPPVNQHVVSYPPLNYILALLAGLISTGFICFSFRRRTRIERRFTNVSHSPPNIADDVPYQRLENLQQERERQLIASTLSLLGLD
jgi:beta-glucosidase